MSIQKRNPFTKEYTDYSPEFVDELVLYTEDLEQVVRCAETGRKISFGLCHTSKHIHNHVGLGFPVCKEAYRAERRQRDLARLYHKLSDEDKQHVSITVSHHPVFAERQRYITSDGIKDALFEEPTIGLDHYHITVRNKEYSGIILSKRLYPIHNFEIMQTDGFDSAEQEEHNEPERFSNMFGLFEYALNQSDITIKQSAPEQD